MCREMEDTNDMISKYSHGRLRIYSVAFSTLLLLSTLGTSGFHHLAAANPSGICLELFRESESAKLIIEDRTLTGVKSSSETSIPVTKDKESSLFERPAFLLIVYLWLLTIVATGVFLWFRGRRSLWQQRSRYRTLVENVSDLITVLDGDGTIRYVSPSSNHILGRSPNQVQGTKFSDCIDAEDRQEFQKLLDRSADQLQRAGALSFHIVNKEGVALVLEAVATVLYFEEERLIVVNFRDITDRVRTEEKVRLLNSDLECRVRSRTLDLQKANAELDAFCSSISHDLRAPLRAILGFSSILEKRLDDQIDAESFKYLKNIGEAGEQMSRLIQDMLEYATLGLEGIHLDEVSLGDVLQDVISTLSTDIEKCAAQVDYPNELPVVVGNRTLFEQIFRNLLGNALIYVRPNRAPRVQIHCDVRESDVLIAVSDNGIGINEGNKERIFRMFQRLHCQ